MSSELTSHYLRSNKDSNLFAKEWSKQEKEKKIPSACRKLVFVDYKEFSDNKEQPQDDNLDLNYSFLSKTFSALSRSNKEKILQVLKNAVNLEKTG